MDRLAKLAAQLYHLELHLPPPEALAAGLEYYDIADALEERMNRKKFGMSFFGRHMEDSSGIFFYWGDDDSYTVDCYVVTGPKEKRKFFAESLFESFKQGLLSSPYGSSMEMTKEIGRDPNLKFVNPIRN